MIFHKTSKYCYNWLKAQPFVKEESLTDWLLYYIANHNKNVYYKAFTRNEEASNGSDWEWWILTNEHSYTKAYRFLIQAKKLKTNDRDNYPLVSYSNQNGYQIDLLITAAKERNALPLYLYYSCCLPDINEQCNNIDYISEKVLRWCEQCCNGCFLTSAFALYRNVFNSPRRKIIDQELINSSFGMSLLDIIWNDSQTTNTLLHNLNDHFKTSNNNMSGRNGIVHNYNDLPKYIKTFIKRKDENLSLLDKEFHYEVRNLNGIVIIDNRNIE